MARIEYGRHKKINGSVDDGQSEIQPSHWNNDAHDQRGILGFDGVTVALASDAFTMTDSAHIIQAQTGVTDDLATIIGTDAAARDEIRLYANPGDTITVKHGTGNIFLAGSQDRVLSETQPLILYFDGVNWREANVVPATAQADIMALILALS